MFGRLGSLGSIETPYFLLENGKVFSEKQPIYLNPDQEAETKVGFADISLNKDKFISNEFFLCYPFSLFLL